jgi:hypothetical protein
MLTVVCKAKKMLHHVQAHLEARLTYLAAIHWLLHLTGQLHLSSLLKIGTRLVINISKQA